MRTDGADRGDDSMSSKDVQSIVRQSTLWAALLVVPLIVNLMVWSLWVSPQRRQLEAWRRAEHAAEIRPQLERVLADSRALVAEGRQVPFSRNDPAAVLQTLQQIAGTHHVQVKTIHTDGQQTAGTPAVGLEGFTSLPLQLDVTGSFGRVTRWMGEVESQPGLQLESWTLAPDSDNERLVRCRITMTAYLRET